MYLPQFIVLVYESFVSLNWQELLDLPASRLPVSPYELFQFVTIVHATAGILF